jgi:DNA-binding MarR family transcriptional regulator
LYSCYTIGIMNKSLASKMLLESFLRLVNKYNQLGKHPMTYGTPHQFYHSERHMLDIVGDNPGLNITEFAKAAGVTKGAISQVVSKLEEKEVLRRHRSAGNMKETKLKLTPHGEKIYRHHQKVNAESISQLSAELDKHPEEHIDFLIHMFNWFEQFLDQSREKMKSHS